VQAEKTGSRFKLIVRHLSGHPAGNRCPDIQDAYYKTNNGNDRMTDMSFY